MEYQLKSSAYTLTEVMIRRMIDNTHSFRDRLIIKLLAGCGLRREEVCNIRTTDIDPEKQVIRIEGKGGKVRMVPFSLEIKNDIYHWLKSDKYKVKRGCFLFPARLKKKSGITPKQINMIVSRSAFLARVANPNPEKENVNPHILRHSFARQMKDRGMSYETLQNILGHASFVTTMNVYGTKSLEDIRKEFQAVSFI